MCKQLGLSRETISCRFTEVSFLSAFHRFHQSKFLPCLLQILFFPTSFCPILIFAYVIAKSIIPRFVFLRPRRCRPHSFSRFFWDARGVEMAWITCRQQQRIHIRCRESVFRWRSTVLICWSHFNDENVTFSSCKFHPFSYQVSLCKSHFFCTQNPADICGCDYCHGNPQNWKQ